MRLASCVSRLKKYRSRKNAPLESIYLDYDQFKHVIMGNLPLVTKIFRNDLVIPEFETFCQNVTSLYEKLKTNFNGEVGKPMQSVINFSQSTELRRRIKIGIKVA